MNDPCCGAMNSSQFHTYLKTECEIHGTRMGAETIHEDMDNDYIGAFNRGHAASSGVVPAKPKDP